MKRRVRLMPVVRTDIAEAARRYEDQEEGVGHRFMRALGEGMRAMRERPHAFPFQLHDMRRARIDPFPYGIFFVERNEQLIVLRVIDLRRNPRAWRSRYLPKNR